MAREEEPNCKWITRLTKRILETPDRFRILQLRKPSIPPPWSPARSGGLRTLEAVRRVRPPTWSTSRVARPPHCRTLGYLENHRSDRSTLLLARPVPGRSSLKTWCDCNNTWPTDPTSLPRPRGSSWESVRDTEDSTHGRPMGRPHDADYIVHSPYNSEQSRATPPNAGGGDMEAFHGADADWGSDEENRPNDCRIHRPRRRGRRLTAAGGR
ncbi:hypothetical protein ACLKA7_005514 [Drosophila subpalustris]